MSDIFQWTAADVMQTDVITVAPDVSVASLLQLLEEKAISGVPVVGSEDNTVEGVVSLSDVARAVSVEATTGQPPARQRDPGRGGPSAYFRPYDVPLAHLPSSLPRSQLGSRSVRDIMTSAVLSVRPDASLVEVATFLDQAGVHRALVMEGPVLVGIVTSMDVVRAVSRAEVSG